MGIFWELWQQSRIERAREEAFDAGVRARQRESAISMVVQTLSVDVDRLVLTVTALSEIVKARFGMTDQEIEAAVREVDLRDGTLDGKLLPSAKACPSCGRMNGPNHRRCIYCSADLSSPKVD